MSGQAGQAAGLAVGAAVGAVAGGAPGAIQGATIGSSVGGAADQLLLGSQQQKLEREALRLNREQAEARAAQQSAVHAQNFRQALASQVALTSMRGGSGSLGMQFGQQAYRTFLEDQEAIRLGEKVTEAQYKLGKLDIANKAKARGTKALSGVMSSFDALNLNTPSTKG